jgi:ribosomal-protein-alanine N-acetyltransferase
MIDVAPMRWWHIRDVATLENVLFPDDPWSTEQFWQELAHDTRHYVVAVDDDAVVGYAGVFALAPEGDVQTIAVAPAAQGAGVGARLLGALLQEAARRQCAHLLLEVRSDNEPALALYERAGFEQISVRRRYYPDGTDALILRRRIDPIHAGSAS